MEVKIRCACGGKYTFPVEPVAGYVPGPVNCPNCGADWVEAVNLSVQSQLAAQSPAAAGTAAPRSGAAPPAPSSAPPPPPPPPAPGLEIKKPALRVQMAAAHPPAMAAAATEEAAPEPVSSPAHVPVAAAAQIKKKARAWGEPNVKLGVIGAVGSAIVTSVLWYLFIDWTTINFSAIALLVGLVIGVTCRMMSGGYSQMLGTICGFCAVFAIIGAQYYAMKTAFNRDIEKDIRREYREKVDYAKRAVKMETDRQIQVFLAGERSGEFGNIDPGEITKEEVNELREEMPELKRYASGELTMEAYMKEEKATYNTGGFNLIILLLSMGIFGWIWLCIGSGLAFKLGTGEVE